ncbi:hypothetical protein [Stenotrophomonas sp. PS02289]|uniref:hypothetical protein n=1 Tax=Stenotrophomonas sp. PS02289 TaxID=2991422 RepID=UPI00249B4B3B|nr:hypothetical protein [Stenotrophomonas sp. PS02289]
MTISQKTGLPLYDQSFVANRYHGMFLHPDVPEADESTDLQPLIAAQGYEAAVVWGENYDDAFSEEALIDGGDAYYAELGAWNPATGDYQGWLVAAVLDTEDGPMAWLVRPAVGDVSRG